MILDNLAFLALWLSVVGLGVFILLILGVVMNNSNCAIAGSMALLVGVLLIGSVIAPIIHPSSEWQEYSDERNESCNECLQDHGWGVTAGDYPNMSPYMYDQCPDCRMCFFP